MLHSLPDFSFFWSIAFILVAGGIASWWRGRVDFKGATPIIRADNPRLFRQVAIAWALITLGAIIGGIYATWWF
jgi:hypothetical protein